ncbi:hypothetical protein [Clostridium sardiniense]|uniref:hypothetical protein n=1 Tax=Clostridium sardiniense TaxID=29369 RepID=UPI00195B718B|nr:hypothetical protein [Clostridium sardiniense]MBM7835615.1 hypothetical protein [Clostridium sardiniense]
MNLKCKNEVKGQYLFMDIEKQRRIIDYREYEDFINKKAIIDKVSDLEKDYHIISGAIICQNGYTKRKVIEKIRFNINKSFGMIKGSKCILSDIVDIHIGEDEYNSKIPFSALIKTELLPKGENDLCKTFFIRDRSHGVKNNILNRCCIFAVKEEKKISKVLKDVWKEYIPKNLIFISRGVW